MNGAKKLALFKVLLTSSAAIWLENLPATTINSWEKVKAAFETRYNPPEFLKYKHANDLFNKKQGSMSVDDFCAQMQRLAREVGAAEDMLRFAVINGFNPEMRNHVTRAQPTTWTDLVQQAKVGEMCMTVPASTDPTLAVKLEAIQDQLTQLALNKTRPASPVCFAGSPESRGRSSRAGSPARHVRFDRSADRGVQEYRNTGPREDWCSRSVDRQPPNNNWDNRGRPQRWDARPPTGIALVLSGDAGSTTDRAHTTMAPPSCLVPRMERCRIMPPGLSVLRPITVHGTCCPTGLHPSTFHYGDWTEQRTTE